MEFLGHTDQLPLFQCCHACFPESLYQLIFLPHFWSTVVREFLGLKVVAWKIWRGQDTGIMDRLDKETLLVFLGTLAVHRDALEVSLEVIVHEMFTGQSAFCLL